jgi:thioredoxin-dependent peroxiredoxin
MEGSMIEEGSTAPDFTAVTDEGDTVTLSSFRGKPVVLYFYPKDDTPGCTAQACGIRDAWGEFRARGAEVFGVSIDDAESHQAFREKHQLPFPLLVDSDRSIGNAYGIGTLEPRFPGYQRSTVVIGPDGTVVKALPNVDAATHADDVLALL